jgi:REP element-mobilizing transposase RayT
MDVFHINKSLPSGHRALRRGRVTLPNACYLITTTTWQREPIFADGSLAFSACACFENVNILKDNAMLCWVLMPDHAHWLIQLAENESLSSLVCRMKAASARAVNRQRGGSRQVWGKAFHDRQIASERTIRSVARYIVANPLRAGLVGAIGDYSFWDAVWL